MHFYDLFNALKNDAEFYLAYNTWRPWFKHLRSLPENARMVPYYEPGKYDLAILDIDQQCVNKRMGKSIVYQQFNALIQDIPKIVINHGTPVNPEFCKIGDDMTFEQAEESCKKQIKEMVGNNIMVVNSFKASEEWGWGLPIIHGMNPDDWLDLPKEPRVFTALSPAGLDLYYNRECIIRVAQLLEEKEYQLYWARVNPPNDEFHFYREFLGRSLIYIDTSIRTPMNRGRTEAMLSGCCVVQVKGAHDLERFAIDGENMILVPNKPEKIAEILIDLIENQYERCVKIGQEAKKTAIKLFNYERYRADWLDLLKIVCEK